MMKTKRKTFRIWQRTSFGIGFEDRKAINKESLKLGKKLKEKLIEIEELD